MRGKQKKDRRHDSKPELRRLMKKATNFYEQLLATEAAVDQLGARVETQELQELKDIAAKRDRKTIRLLDKSIEDELKDLEKKLYDPRFPRNEKEIFRELIDLLRKIFQKLVEIQKWLPPIPPVPRP
jgi:hypothetical protein